MSPRGLVCACIYVCLKRHSLLLNLCQQRGLYLNERQRMSGFAKTETWKSLKDIVWHKSSGLQTTQMLDINPHGTCNFTEAED